MHVMKSKFQRSLEHTDPVFHASHEIYGRRLGKIFGRAGHLADSESEMNDLTKHLIVKDKVIVIRIERQVFEYGAVESPVSCMVFGKFLPDKDVLNQRQDSI